VENIGMATLAPLGVLDLSWVTQTLLTMLGNYMNTAAPIPMSIIPTGAMPDAVRQESGTQLTLSLFHVTEDKFTRNSPLLNSRAQPIPFQPMSLDLYYLLSAFAQKDWQQEQQAMTLAMQFFYQTPIISMAVSTLPGLGTVNEEFTLTMEIETSDEMARLWQAITFPIRLSVVYKVSVVLLTPPATPTLAPKVTSMQLAADPTLFPYSQSGQVLGVVWTASFASPLSSVLSPDIVNIDYSPAVVPLGQRFFLYGVNLNQPTSSRVYFLAPDGTETEVTGWKTTEVDPTNPHFQTVSRITLDLPTTLTGLPAGAQSPGVYQLRAGSQSPADPNTNRTNAAPFSIAAWIDTSSVPPPNPPFLLPDGTGTYTLNGQGFVAGQTEILLDTVPSLFTVVSPQQATFKTPATLPSGRYTVRVRVNGVESPPSWWINT
jgi:Pvc16 N-terminal domain/IPT/TIG domain